MHVTKKKEKKVKDELMMAPLCFRGPHLEAITDVIQREFCKTQLEPGEEPRRGHCQREEEGEPRDGVRFPHHEEIVWLGFWNHKTLSEAKGEMGMQTWRQREMSWTRESAQNGPWGGG